MADFNPIFEETEESVRARIFADIDAAWGKVSNLDLDKREGSVLWLLTAGFTKEMTKIYDEMNQVAELAFPQFLAGDFLTDKALEYGLVRLSEQTAEGWVQFYGDAGSPVSTGIEVSTIGLFEDDEVLAFTVSEEGAVSSDTAPASAPTVGSGGAGSLTGSYSYLFTFVEVDIDGNPITETAAGTASADYSASSVYISITGFPALPSTDHRLRIYRTDASGAVSDVYRLVVEISDPAQTSFLDKFEDEQLGSYFVWDGTSGENFDINRTAGPIIAYSDPSAIVRVQAVEPGELYNVTGGDLTNLVDATTGIEFVSNPYDINTGRDEEDDDTFRDRLLEFLRTPQGAGTVQDYETWGAEFPGVGMVQVFPNWDGTQDRPGYVNMVVADTNFDPLSSTFLSTMQEGGIINGTVFEGIDPSPTGSGRGKAPIGAKVIIETVHKDPCTITLSVKEASGYALTPATGQTNLSVLINQSLSGLIDNLKPGDVLYESAIVEAVYNTEGVEDVLVDSASAVVIAVDETSNPPGDAYISTTDASGNVTLGRKQVLEYDSDNSTLTAL